MNYDKYINAASIIATVGLIISAIGIATFRYYTNKKNAQSFALTSKEINELNNKLKSEFETTITEIQTQKENINKKIEDESILIIDELKEKSKDATKAIELLRKESNKASIEIALEIEKVKKATEIQLPIKINGYIALQEYSNGLMQLLNRMYNDGVPVEPPNNLNEFLTPSYINKIWEYLYLDSDPDIIPHKKYSEYISANSQYYYQKGDNILKQYSKAIDPKVIRNIHIINESDQIKLLRSLNSIKNMIQQVKTPILNSCVPQFSEVQLKALRDINEWCMAKNKEFKEFGIDEKLLFKYLVKGDYNNPKNIAPKEILDMKIKPKWN